VGTNLIGFEITDDIQAALKGVDMLVLNNSGKPYAETEEVTRLYEENNVIEQWKELLKQAYDKGIDIVCTTGIYHSDLNEWKEEEEIEIYRPFESEEKIKETVEKYSNISPSNKIKKIGVFGTKSCIEKFTTQMKLYRELMKNYEAKALITEPTAFLFSQPQLTGFNIGY